MVRIVIFGTGIFYKKRREKFYKVENIQICAFLDNNKERRGTFLDNIPIFSPQDLNNINYDYIVLMSGQAPEMYEQLIEKEVERSKILYWEEFNAKFYPRKKNYCVKDCKNTEYRKKVLIITSNIGYDGGAITAIYAAKCLQLKGYKVDLLAPDGNIRLINEINSYNIEVILYNILPYIDMEEWMKEYNIVIVNTFPMIQCACKISQYRPVLWWIHESSCAYCMRLKQFSIYANIENMQKINIYAVSNIAKRNFNFHFLNRIQKVLNYGIPDMCKLSNKLNTKKGVIFAIVGAVYELKAQKVFLEAANRVKTDNEVEFWIIGEIEENAYGIQVMELVQRNSRAKVMGVLSREEIYHIFPEIDVVVCPSKEDSLPIVMTEAMMFHKVCIASDHTGTADFIIDGENGFIVETNNVEMLRERMQWAIDHKEQLARIGDNARKTYEKYFSMEVFVNNLEQAVKETIAQWNES